MSNESYQVSNMEEQLSSEGRSLTASEPHTPSKSHTHSFLKASLAIGIIGVVCTLAYFATSEPKASFKSGMLMPLMSKGDPKAYRIDENESKIFGDDRGGWEFDKKCKQGSYVKHFETKAGAVVDAIGVKCSDGNWAGHGGNWNAGGHVYYYCGNNYNAVKLQYGWNGIGKFTPFCDGKEQKQTGWGIWLGSYDKTETFNCPWGQFIYGISGRETNNRLLAVRFHCAKEAPTAYPTLKPTPVPTPVPTTKPTDEPSPVPTAKPTDEPSPVPTAKPTDEPTPVPTAKPTDVTIAPTPNPSKNPTVFPSAQPTFLPTPNPLLCQCQVKLNLLSRRLQKWNPLRSSLLPTDFSYLD